MKNKQAICILITAVLASVMLGIALLMSASDSNSVANVYVDGKLYHSIDLNDVKNNYTIDIPNSEDKHNIILVEKGAISMQSADCPDKLCVKQGKISGGSYPIVCLPHKIIISIEDEKNTDAVLR